jgi:16S rRNA (adenine1518-N6/adenine1519-N6)-dimethyltransferase
VKHIAKKRFGQHFLVDVGVIDKIVSAIDPQLGQAVVEIGPGQSAITRPLLNRLDQLCVVELDRDLAQILKGNPRLKVIQADVLTVHFGQFFEELGTKPLRVVGNLPYIISTPILFHLLKFVEMIQDQHFMLQKEVVDRMLASPNSSDYGRLSVMLQWRYEMTRVLDVGMDAFDPPPRVLSAVVKMVPRKQAAILDEAKFSEMVQVAFSQRRKILRHTLEPWLAQRSFKGEFDFQRRAQEVGVKEFIEVVQSLCQ